MFPGSVFAVSINCILKKGRTCFRHRLLINSQVQCILPSNARFRSSKSFCIQYEPPLSSSVMQCRYIHSSKPSFDLMEFFDDPKNWGEKEVRTGRSWTKDDLRIKSNSDLHKLWYVLLKERNMLLTMEEEGKRVSEYFPNPERIDKVEISMENLEEVIRERNRAYHLLETGETGERQSELKENEIGLTFKCRKSEHIIPEWQNTSFQKNYHKKRDRNVGWFLARLQEQKMERELRRERGKRHHVRQLLKRFPNMDMDALKQQFPDVDIKKIQRSME